MFNVNTNTRSVIEILADTTLRKQTKKFQILSILQKSGHYTLQEAKDKAEDLVANLTDNQ
jgi:hypothetical protein